MVSENGKGSNLWANCRWWIPSAPGAGMLLVWPCDQVVSQFVVEIPNPYLN